MVLSVENLKVVFNTYAGRVEAVNGVSFDLAKGEILAIVGESGCGKSVTAGAIMGLIPSPPGEITQGEVLFENNDLLKMNKKELNSIRGNLISMVFQEQMTSLNPVLTIGSQLAESYTIHQNLSMKEALARSVDMLEKVGISEPESRLGQYPHQLSGGMRQRVMIAMALACRPKILIADEPTTALDVTIQAQIIDLLKSLNKEFAMSIILITHDLGLVAGICSRVMVMYAGRMVEMAPLHDLYGNPQHPYTFGLLRSAPRIDQKKKRLEAIKGKPPDLLFLPPGCAFLPRCPFAMQICQEAPPLFPAGEGHEARCWLLAENSPRKPEELFKGGESV